MKAAVQRIHGSADHRAVFAFYPVFNRDQRLRIFCRDAKNTGQPHPQDRSRTAHRDRSADADDIPGSDRRGQRRRQRAKLGDIPLRIGILCYGEPDRLKNILLNKARPERHKNMSSKQKNDQRPSPQKTIDLVNDRAKRHMLPPDKSGQPSCP